MSAESKVIPTLKDPLSEAAPAPAQGAVSLPPGSPGPYDEALAEGLELRARPRSAASAVQILRQHAKDRMTVWERIDVLSDPGARPQVLYQNWGKNLDGASIVTALVCAWYGGDATVTS